MTRPSAPALIVIDVQVGLDEPRLGARNNPDAERHMAALLAAWRQAEWPVIHVQHMSTEPDSPLRPELPGNALKPEVQPVAGEPLFRKHVSNAFAGTGLEAHLRRAGVEQVVVMGLTTDHCVSSTARSASDLGFAVVVVADACATHERIAHDGRHHDAETMHRAALASLHCEFARVRTTAEVLAQVTAARGR